MTYYLAAFVEAEVTPAKARGNPKSLLHGYQRQSRRAHRYALRVATAGGTEAALRAGPYTAICPSSHNSAAPRGR